MYQQFDTSRGDDIATYRWQNEKCTDTTAIIKSQNLISDNSRCLHEKSNTIKTFEVKLEASINAQDNKTKTMDEKAENANENMKQSKSSVTTSRKTSKTNFNNLKKEISKIRTIMASDNTEMKKSINDIRLQMAQMAENSKKMSESLEKNYESTVLKRFLIMTFFLLDLLFHIVILN